MEERQRCRKDSPPDRSGRPRWPAAVALLGVRALYAVILGGLTHGPRAFLLDLVAGLLVPSLSVHLRGSHRPARGFGFGVISLVTLAIIVSAFLLVSSPTAFSPTDTAFLSRWAKLLMMVLALLSLVILAVLVSRVINALAAA